MVCKLEDLKNKSVVNIKNGVNLGFVDDISFDTYSSQVLSLVIYGRKRFFGIFGREEDILIPWDNIKIIGDDVVLVNIESLPYFKSNFKYMGRRKPSCFILLFRWSQL